MLLAMLMLTVHLGVTISLNHRLQLLLSKLMLFLLHPRALATRIFSLACHFATKVFHYYLQIGPIFGGTVCHAKLFFFSDQFGKVVVDWKIPNLRAISDISEENLESSSITRS